jgi:hypothetical protein
MKTKSVDWAYPTSINAKRFKFPKLGCWVVNVCNGRTTETLAGFPGRTQALEYAEALPYKWDSAFLEALKRGAGSEEGRA